jgi:aminoglycoside/choline kinase family phosphotransferase
MDRDTLKINFLDSNKLGASKRIALKKDASHRVYERIIKEDGGSFVLMDAPPEKEKVEPFIRVANLLLQNDFSAPKIIAQDIENGFLLLEDFGDDSFTNILSGKSKLSGEIEEVQMYERAVDNLIRLHKLPTNSAGLANYDEGMLIKESMRFVQFYLEVLNCERIDKVVQEEYVIIFKHLLSIAKNFANVIVLRDYHADNLMWLDDRLGYRKVGLLDFQDAVIGSPVYDLVSLLEDARRDVTPQLADKMIKRYLQAFPNLSQKEFAATYAIYAVQRNLKIVGVFARLATTHKNPYYLTLLPRVWRHINNDLKHPLLLPLKKWLIKRVPMQMKY